MDSQSEERASTTKTVPYKLFRGFPVPQSAREDYFEWMADHRGSPGDVFVVSFPKCGTTWLQHVVYLLHKGGVAPNSMKEVIEAVPFPEQDGPSITGGEGIEPIALKTHLPLHLLNLEPRARYLYVARNPKDACVSYYHFLKNLPGYEIESFDSFFEAFLSGQIPHGDILDHVLPWHAARHQPNVLFLTYEGLSNNRKQEINKVARFLGHSDLSDHTMREIVHCTSFEAMRSLAKKDSFMRSYLNASTGIEGDGRGKGEPIMMRRGVVGDWRNYLSPEQSHRMDRHFWGKERGSGLEKEWLSEIDH